MKNRQISINLFGDIKSLPFLSKFHFELWKTIHTFLRNSHFKPVILAIFSVKYTFLALHLTISQKPVAHFVWFKVQFTQERKYFNIAKKIYWNLSIFMTCKSTNFLYPPSQQDPHKILKMGSLHWVIIPCYEIQKLRLVTELYMQKWSDDLSAEVV